MSEPMLLVRGADVFDPAPIGRQDLLLAGGRIVAMAPRISPGAGLPVRIVQAAGRIAVPGLVDSLAQPVTLGVMAGLLIGKPIGVFGTSYLLARFTGARLDDDLAWRDVFGMSLLAGIGFTVSLLIGELAFGFGHGNK